jgi:hypothetical protein
MNAPSHWTEVPAKQKQTTTFISSNHLAGYKSMLSAPIDFSSDSANLTNTRTWTLSPGETEFAFPAYVFEFTVVVRRLFQF